MCRPSRQSQMGLLSRRVPLIANGMADDQDRSEARDGPVGKKPAYQGSSIRISRVDGMTLDHGSGEAAAPHPLWFELISPSNHGSISGDKSGTQ